MALFKIVENSKVVLKRKGTYMQVDTYERDGVLFARVGAGFVGLRPRGGTTSPDLLWDEIDNCTYVENATGPLVIRGSRADMDREVEASLREGYGGKRRRA